MAQIENRRRGQATAPEKRLDFTVFEYILSLDDSDDNDSGQNLVFGFLGKAEETFDSIEESL